MGRPGLTVPEGVSRKRPPVSGPFIFCRLVPSGRSVKRESVNQFSTFQYSVLVAAGVASGFINTVAGGGSFLTMPALMLLGMPADIANGTNRPSVLAQSVSTVLGFHSAGKFDRQAAVWILAASAAGVLIGALGATWLPVSYLKPVLLGSMVIISALMFAKPELVLPPKDAPALSIHDRPVSILWFVLTGIYGGFVQGGIGFLSLMVLCGTLHYDLVRANALKIAISGISGIIPLAVFLYTGKVLWIPAIVLSVAAIAGSRLGVGFAVTAKHETLRVVLFVTVLAVTVAAFLKS